MCNNGKRLKIEIPFDTVFQGKYHNQIRTLKFRVSGINGVTQRTDKVNQCSKTQKEGDVVYIQDDCIIPDNNV
jgi:hypothetical protein